MLDFLSKNEKRLLNIRYGGSGAKSFSATAKEYGCTIKQVKKAEETILKKVQKAIHPDFESLEPDEIDFDGIPEFES